MANEKEQQAMNDYLIRGSEYMEGKEDFELVGRDEELRRLSKALTRESASSVILCGPGGVGCSALCMGLQESKKDENVPFDIVGKRFYWLDTDGLFASGDTARINKSFKRALENLSRNPDSVLVIDDMRDFIDAANSNGCSNLVNALMREIKQKKFQAILETEDDDIEVVLKCHSDMKENFTLIDIEQPDQESLKLILKQASKKLEKHHRIKISDEARETAIEMTSKFLVRDMGLSRAQPERSVTLLDRSLTSYRLNAHEHDPRLDELNRRLESINAKLDNENYSKDQGGKSKGELEIEKAALESDVEEVTQEWGVRQKKIRGVYSQIRKGEEEIRRLEEQIDVLRSEELKRKQQVLERAANQDDRDVSDRSVEKSKNAFETLDDISDSSEILAVKRSISEIQDIVDEEKENFHKLTADINDDLELTKEHVLEEFSAISGVPVSKLTQDEKEKLRNLEQNLGNRVWGQDEAVTKLADEVLSAKAGLQDPDKPQAAFLYLGPSGVGKTELAKALASEVLDNERAILRFDMSEYQEKHALAKLIGAPPGYEGYDAGGILTNAMRRNPNRIILFDEIEKAHPDIFLIFLQILDDARLTDSHGLTVSFRDSIIIMTSNAGKEHFIDPDLTFEEASELAMAQLGDVEKGGLPPELLNRFNGRENIVCFKTLPLDVIHKIARREVSKLNQRIAISNPGLSIAISDDELAEMCDDRYEPVHGARGVQGYIGSNVKKEVGRTILFEEGAEGVMQVEYDKGSGVTVHPPKLIVPENPELVRPSDAAVEKFGNVEPS